MEAICIYGGNCLSGQTVVQGSKNAALPVLPASTLWTTRAQAPRQLSTSMYICYAHLRNRHCNTKKKCIQALFSENICFIRSILSAGPCSILLLS